MRTIIVTGGAGFIGSNLCQFLISRGDKVICLDNLLTGSEKNVASLLSNKNFFFFEHDVTRPFTSKKFTKIDQVFHLASPADPNTLSKLSYMSHPFETMQVNSNGTWNMCQMALKYKAKLLFASTSEIYGDPLVSPQKETYRGNVSTTGPRAVYDEAKRFGETIVSAYVREKGLDGRIIRIFNTYGPGMNPNEGRAVVHFINQALKNEPITIYGDGSQTRSFCFIDDQIEGLVKAMEVGGTRGEVFNIGNSQEKTILDFAKIIKRLTKSKSQIKITQSLPIDDPTNRNPDISKAKSVLSWKPKVSLEKGLVLTIDYFRENL